MPGDRLPQVNANNEVSPNGAISTGEFEPFSLDEIIAIYRRWFALGLYTFIGLLVPAVVVIFLILPLYEAHGSLWVDRNSPSVSYSVKSDPAGNTTFRNVNRDEEIATTAELFKAREIAEALVVKFDLTMAKLNTIRDARRYVQMAIDGVIDLSRALYDGLKSLLGLGVPLTAEEKAELEHIRVVDEVIERILVTPQANSNVLEVSFRSSDPVLARDMTNALLDEFIVFYTKVREDRANRFFTDTTDRLKDELSAAENDILQLQKQTTNFMSAEQEGALVLNYEQTKEALRRLKIQESKLRSQITAIHAKLDKEPNSVQLRESLRSNVVNLEIELASLMEEKKSTAEVLDEYKNELDTVASVNLRLRSRTREAAILEEQYQMSVTNLEKARAGQAMNSASINAVRIVSYAPYPLKTIRPRKLLYLAIAFIGSLLVGLAMPFLAYLNDRTISDESDVRKYLGLEFVGSFPNLEKYNVGRY